jgi:hypothetical protein
MVQPSNTELITEKRQKYRDERAVHRKTAKQLKWREAWRRPLTWVTRKGMEWITYATEANRQSALVSITHFADGRTFLCRKRKISM